MDGEPLPPGAVFRLGSTRLNPTTAIKRVVVLPGGQRYLTSDGRRVRLHDVATNAQIGEPMAFSGSIGAISADGRRVACGERGDIAVYDIAAGRRLFQLTREQPVYYTEWPTLSADGTRVAAGFRSWNEPDAPLECAVWDVDSGDEVARVTTIHNVSTTAVLSPDAKTLVTRGEYQRPGRRPDPKTGSLDPDKLGQVTQIWDLVGKTESGRIDLYPCYPFFSPDSALAAATVTDKVLLLDLRTGKPLRTLPFPDGSRSGRPTFSPDGKTVASVGRDKTARWEVATGRLLGATPHHLPRLPGEVSSHEGGTFDPTGRLIVGLARGQASYCWDAVAGKAIHPVPTTDGHAAAVHTVAFAAGGKEIRTAAKDGTIGRWDAATGGCLGQVDLHPPGQELRQKVLLSADGRRVAVERRVHQLPDGKPLADVQPALHSLTCGLSADGATIAVMPEDADKPAHIVLYDAATGRTTAKLPYPPKANRRAAVFSPDRRRVYTMILSAPYDGSDPPYPPAVAAWDAATGTKLGEVTYPKGVLLDAIAPVGDRAVAVSAFRRTDRNTGDGVASLSVVDPETGKTACDLTEPHAKRYHALTASPDGRRLAVFRDLPVDATANPRAIAVYDVATWELRHTVPIVQRRTRTEQGVSYPEMESCDALDVAAGHVWIYMGFALPPEVMAFSPDGTRLATPAGNTVLVWDFTRFTPDGDLK